MYSIARLRIVVFFGDFRHICFFIALFCFCVTRNVLATDMHYLHTLAFLASLSFPVFQSRQGIWPLRVTN
jgi:hypothetical protein